MDKKNYLLGSLFNRKQGVPIFENSFPKSGTHFLKNILLKMSPGMSLSKHGVIQPLRYNDRKIDHTLAERQLRAGNFQILSDPDYNSKTYQTLEDWNANLASAKGKTLILGHIEHDPDFVNLIRSYDIHKLFLYRDPRDIVISRTHYLSKTEGEITKRLMSIYFRTIESFDERVKMVITGNSYFPRGHILHFDIGRSFQNWMGWLGEPGVLAIKYEDLISEDILVRRATLEGIVQHCNVDLSDSMIDRMETAYSIRPPTFRKGIRGSWQSELSSENKTLFKDIAGQLLIDLGYERNLDW